MRGAVRSPLSGIVSSSAGSSMPNRQAIWPRGLSHRRCADEEANASMNGKDGAPIVEAADRIDVRAAQKRAPQWRRCVIGGEAGRQDEADSSAALRQRQCALDEHLVAIHVGPPPDGGRRRSFERTLSRSPPARSMSQGGFPITASKPPSASGRPASSKYASGNSSIQ